MPRILILGIRGKIESLLTFSKYNVIAKEDDLIEMIEEALSQNPKLKTGDILVAKLGDENTQTIEGRYTIETDDKGKRTIQFSECELKLTVKSTGEKKKMWSQKEKIALLKEFFIHKSRVPEKDETYKNCPIGVFYHDVSKWSDVCEEVKTARDENVEI